ncbi:hypothetical protein [Nocardia thailandica]|uniref:hypothetical protein n=1 Tax=Nocardia thailandica TaxID=257275 RepID=UPI00031FBDD5|nr:hypothetical protein [Nocardia thailandica]
MWGIVRAAIGVAALAALSAVSVLSAVSWTTTAPVHPLDHRPVAQPPSARTLSAVEELVEELSASARFARDSTVPREPEQRGVIPPGGAADRAGLGVPTGDRPEPSNADATAPDSAVRADTGVGAPAAPQTHRDAPRPDGAAPGEPPANASAALGDSPTRLQVAGADRAVAAHRTPPASSPSRAPARVPAVAYRTRSEFVVVREGAETVRVPGDFAGTEPVAFTRDGGFAFTVAGGTVVAVAVVGGAVSKIGCACASAVALRDDLVVWSQDAVVMRAALATPGGAARHQPLRWPDPPTPPGPGAAFGATEILAAGAHSMMLARRETVDGAWSGTHLYAVPDEGEPRALGRVDGLDTDVAAALGPDGHTFVLTGRRIDADDSCPQATAATVDAGSGRTTPLAAAPGPCATAHRPRAEPDGSVTAILQHWAPGTPPDTARARATTRTWSPLADTPVLESQRRSDGAVAELVATTSAAPGELPLGRLTLSTPSGRTVLAEGVSAIAAR